ncbi:MAG: outer membrane protein assembly factor BamD [Bacteroidales bacterium]|nr:outer membrane protein assembly factor BamD [Bacteroidales bacterium]
MFKNRAFVGVVIAGIAMILSGCGEYEKLLKSRDYQKKYETGVTMYEEGTYVKAATLFDQVANIYRGTIKADTVKYYQAKSYYGQRDYMMAGHYFSELSATYPNSNFLEEADFMTAYCYYKQSPRPELDQDNTYKTITALQMFMVKYPNSERLSECQQIIVEMSDKLVEKSYISAKLYYDLGYYKSAILALRNSLMNYPETRYREELMFLILKSSYLLADKSIPSKQRERFQAALDEYYSFIGEFPDGIFSKEATRIYESSNKFLADNNNES